MSSFRNFASMSGVLLLCFAGLSSASAEQPDVVSVPVKFARADLETPAGVRKLYWRIQLAARLACGAGDLRDISQSRPYRTCFDNAVQKAVSDINAAELTALHHNKTQRTATAQHIRVG